MLNATIRNSNDDIKNDNNVEINLNILSKTEVLIYKTILNNPNIDKKC